MVTLFDTTIVILCKRERKEERKKMTRGKQKIEAQKKNAEKNQKNKGSQFEARAVALKIVCPRNQVRGISPGVADYASYLMYRLPDDDQPKGILDSSATEKGNANACDDVSIYLATPKGIPRRKY
ncbi:zinc finger, C2H2 [Tanacetum coccineum]